MCDIDVIISAMSAEHHFINHRRSLLCTRYSMLSCNLTRRLFWHRLDCDENEAELVVRCRCWCSTWFRSSVHWRCSSSNSHTAHTILSTNTTPHYFPKARSPIDLLLLCGVICRFNFWGTQISLRCTTRPHMYNAAFCVKDQHYYC